MKKLQDDINWWKSFPETNPNPVIEISLQSAQVLYSNSSAQKLLHSLSEKKRIAFMQICIRHNAENPDTNELHIEKFLLGTWYSIKLQPSLEYNSLRVFFIDTTILKEAAENMRVAKHMAEDSAKIKSSFLANMSHEIRTPMNGIIWATNLIQETSLDDEQIDFINTIQYSAESLLTIINDVLDFSKIESGKLELDIIEFNTSVLIHEVIKILRPIAHSKNVDLSYRISKSVPAQLYGDEGRIRQVLINLLSNAIKFADSGSVRLIADLSTAEEDGFVGINFEVQDNGIGMSEEDLHRLFKPFSQADASTTRRFGGTGLGLVICKKIVELMNGSISVFSQDQEGSIFCVNIPLKPATEQASKEHQDNDSGFLNKISDQLKGKKVLLAEDNIINQKLAKRIFEKIGFVVSIACDGKEASQAACEFSFDVIFMDMQMPIMDGLSATRSIREYELESNTQRHTPIIAMTANAFKEDREACLESGMDAYLAKPVNIEKLLSVVNTLILQK
ncbi:MAG: response regulator [Planctomycetes bacterium]|nr:response regulator [Planctomycetota bacterium]